MSEGVVQDALDKASHGRTTITMCAHLFVMFLQIHLSTDCSPALLLDSAHRLSTIKDAHKILVMGGGEILESGTHNELLATEGPYANLVAGQKLAAAEQKAAAVAGTAEDDSSSDEAHTLLPAIGANPIEKIVSSNDAEEFTANEKSQLERTATGQTSISSQIMSQRVANKMEVPKRSVYGCKYAILRPLDEKRH